MTSLHVGHDLAQRGADLVLEAFIEIVRQPADARVCRRQPDAGQLLDDRVEFLARGEQIPEVGQRPQIDDVGAVADAVIHDPRQLVDDDADELAAVRHLDAAELLHRFDVGDVVAERRNVIHPAGVRHDVVPGALFGALFEAAVQVADLRNGVLDRLAFEFDQHAQGAVRHRMAGADVDQQALADFGVGGIQAGIARPGDLAGMRQRQFVFQRLGARAPLAPGPIVIFAQRVADELVMAQDPFQVRMAVEADAEHVPALALGPIRRLPQIVHAVEARVGFGDRNTQPQAPAVPQRIQLVDDLEPLHAVAQCQTIDRGQIHQHVEAQLGIVAQRAQHAPRRIPAHHEDDVAQRRRFGDETRSHQAASALQVERRHDVPFKRT